MKILTIFCFILLFNQQVFTLTCPTGYYQQSGYPLCLQCDQYLLSCQRSGLGFKGSVNSRLVGWKNVNEILNAYCVASAGSISLGLGSYYNKQTNQCQHTCKTGCKTCSIDYDFCNDCDNGYLWNNDFTCIPAVIGLQAASLAILVIGLVFGIISCCVVIRAKKN